MDSILIFFFTLIFAAVGISQPAYDAKRDYVWIFGYGTVIDGLDRSRNVFFDFKQDTMVLSFQVRYGEQAGDDFFQTSASICDTDGNFLFYSNGCVLADSAFQYFNGADTINQGPKWNEICKKSLYRTFGYIVVNGCWILPVAENKFKAIYTDKIASDTINYGTGLRTSTVVRNAQTGELTGYGADTYIYQGPVDPPKRAVVRHGNGRDWWLVNSLNNTRKHISILIDSTDNIHNPVVTETLELSPIRLTTSGQSCFSPNGSTYASFDYKNACLIFDFDRCTGQLSNMRKIMPPVNLDTIVTITGVAISPNSRFLYLMTKDRIFQYDLWNTDIESSVVTVAIRDNWVGYLQSGNPDYPPSFYQSQLGPDGKIYIFNPAARRTFAVIESPDSLGLDCNVVQHKYFFPQWVAIAQPPRFPNYRLGSLAGSPCDSLTVGTTASGMKTRASLILRPNPATDYTIVDIGLDDYSASQHILLNLCDATGKLLRQKQVPPYTPLQRIETGSLPAGLYFVQLVVQGQVKVTRKLVVGKL
jgi:Secretion system C-terminal sorting domain